MHPNLQQKLDVFTRKFHQTLGRAFLALQANKRPTSYPYISGDSFRALANHVFDETGTFDPTVVMPGDIVFVGQIYFHIFFNTIHTYITNPYILIVHNGDAPMDEEALARIDEKIIHCFAQDVTFYHNKVTPIPIGIENKHYFINGLTYFYDYITKSITAKPPKRQNKIFYSFSIGTNPVERTKALQFLQSYPHTEKPSQFLTPIRHSKTLLRYKFVASPPGNAIESCRTWEAMYLGVVPIVKNYVAMQYFKQIGLPLWIINDWNEISSYSTEELSNKYKLLMESANFQPLYMDYWIKLIRDAQKI